MSEWADRITSHRIWTLLEGVGPKIDVGLALEDITPEGIAGLERLKAVLTLVGKRLAGTDVLTIPLAALDSLAGLYDAQQNEIDGFLNDKNLVHLTSANANADSSLVILGQIPGVTSEEELICSIADVEISAFCCAAAVANRI